MNITENDVKNFARIFPFFAALICAVLAALQIPFFPIIVNVIIFVMCFSGSIGNLILGVLIYNEYN